MKFLQQILHSELGLTLTEMTIVTGMVGVAALGAATLMGGIGKSTKEAEMVASKTEFASHLGVYLYSSIGCNDLKNAPTTSDHSFAAAGDTELELTKWTYDGVSDFKSGTELKYFSLQSLKGSVDLSPSNPTVKVTYPDGSTKDLMRSILKVRANLKMHERTYLHEFDVPVLLNSSRIIEFCSSEKTLAETCTSLKGTFDALAMKCNLNQTCEAYGSYVTLNCSPQFVGVACDTSRGTPVINPVTGTLGCPIGTTAVSTGADTWTVNQNCGKKCTADINTTIGYFTCLKCP